ncbi:hypothetical protein C0Q70_01715 [Pomacea canaliculata]|uniref:Band 3 cytoplasmic domain-containing protein n=1 Tax=Pomacea canaliculata TaxID=400727 RepID=A0A2T7Q0C0_POMCA|nr:hypothetical protein C0Q70_01715 [Pomacea canaliculata]
MDSLHPTAAENGSVPLRDMGSRRDFNEEEIDVSADSHRATYIHLRLPKRPRRPHRGSSHSRKRQAEKPSSVVMPLSPSEQIQILLGEGDDRDQAPKVFCQMDALEKPTESYQWKETARWVKYEEDVEEGGERWSKPHVASLSYIPSSSCGLD